MQLPRTDKMPEKHSEQISPAIRACILDDDVSKLLARGAADAAMCTVAPRLLKVQPGPQYCWVCVTYPRIDAGVCTASCSFPAPHVIECDGWGM